MGKPGAAGSLLISQTRNHMPSTPPAFIEHMKVCRYADTTPYAARLGRFMKPLPHWLLVVEDSAENTFCILGTDAHFGNWEQYANYVFKDLPTALEAPEVVFKTGSVRWIMP
jgi:hypothetical protein